MGGCVWPPQLSTLAFGIYDNGISREDADPSDNIALALLGLPDLVVTGMEVNWESLSSHQPGNHVTVTIRELLNFVLIHALYPFFGHTRTLLPQPWKKRQAKAGTRNGSGASAHCGGEPDFAFLDEDSGNRHLVCSRCDSAWLFPRIKCAVCGTTDSVYRVYVCTKCRRYLKVVESSSQIHSDTVLIIHLKDVPFFVKPQI